MEYPHVKNLINISLVCSRLHDIIDNTPQFWAFIVPHTKLQITTQLTKSSNCPIRIHKTSWALTPDITALLSSHMHRWQNVHVDRWKLEYWDLSHGPAPFLESFCAEKGRPGRTLDLFQDLAPRLRHLDIGNHCISWESRLMRGLTFLRLCAWDPHAQATPTSEQYLKMLMGCPKLEELHLYGHLGSPSTLPLTHTLQADVHLKYLVRLSFKKLQAAIVQSFLCHIKATPSLDITTPSSPESVAVRPWIRAALNGVHNYTPIKTVLSNPNGLEITRSGWPQERSKWKIYTWGGITLPDFRISFKDRGHSINPLSDILPQPSFKHITYLRYYSESGLEGEWLNSQLPNLHNLVYLWLGAEFKELADPEVVCSILEKLTSPSYDKSSSSPHGCRWLSPKLEELTLSYLDVECEGLLPFVRSRVDGNQANPLAFPNDEVLPVRLRKLTIESDIGFQDEASTDTTLLRIAELLGQGLVWNDKFFDKSKGWQSLRGFRDDD
ncbi:hypothetical protein FRC02_012475 [Tulasnella sp. 418]|nr:hypothetical protein FRC02_012475 [Tulasnella sp. 418]